MIGRFGTWINKTGRVGESGEEVENPVRGVEYFGRALQGFETAGTKCNTKH